MVAHSMLTENPQTIGATYHTLRKRIEPLTLIASVTDWTSLRKVVPGWRFLFLYFFKER